MMRAVEVAKLAVDEAMTRSGAVPPEGPSTATLAKGEEVPTPKLPWMVEFVVVPVTVRVPLIVVESVMESPKVLLFSTVKVEMVVLERVTEPSVVRFLAKTSPSASTINLAAPATDTEKRFESATALAEFTISAAVKGDAPTAPVAHEEKVWATVGAKV